MPASRRASQRVPRCSYTERGADGRVRQCTFNGLGNPPLCGPHRMVIEQAATPQVRRAPGEAFRDLVGSLFSGQQVTREDVQRTIEAEAWAMGGHIAQNFYPHPDDPNAEQDDLDDFDPNDQPPQEPRSAGPPPGWRSRWSRTEHAQPAPDFEQARARAAARHVLGFAPGEALTQAKVKGRHRELAKKFHPDRAEPAKRPAFEKKMRDINAAVDIVMEGLPP